MYSAKLKQHIKHSKAAAEANKAKGNRHVEILSSLYSDTSRFIEELLQNANDACLRNASDENQKKVKFVLLQDQLLLYHNGIHFDEKDLISITTIGQSTKTGMSDVNMIGKFGLGFKSVFAICDEPEIHSGDFHFKIKDFEVLAETDPISDEGFGTCIVLPLKKKPHTYTIVNEGLNKIGWQHLLFVLGYDQIEIVQEGKSKIITRSTIRECGKSIQYIKINNDSFLTFSPDRKKDAPVLALKISFDANDNLSYSDCSFENTFVHYPTLYPSGLKFLIHAGFTTTPTREQIPFTEHNTPENLLLLKRITDTVSHLPGLLIKQHLLDPSFWEIMPVFNVVTPNNAIQDAVCKGLLNAIETQEVLPSSDGKFCGMEDLCVVPEKISALFTKKEILQLYGRKHILCNELSKIFQLNPEIRSRFKNIKYTDIQDFAFSIGNHPEILNSKKPPFHISFLKIISENPELWNTNSSMWYNILEKPFILSSNGKVTAPFQNGETAIFISNTRNKSFQTAHPELLKDSQVVDFLQRIGIPTADELIEFDHLILKVFKSKTPVMKKTIAALEEFFVLFKTTPENTQARMIAALSKTKCIPATSINDGKKVLALPNKVYFPEENVLQFFKGQDIQIIDQQIITHLTSKGLAQSEIVDVFKQLGVNDKPAFVYFEQTERTEELEIEKQNIEKTGLTILSHSFKDVDIDGLKDFMDSPSLQKSIIIASMLTKNFPAARIDFETYTQQITKELRPSFLQKLLIKPWLFDTDETLKSAMEISILHPAYAEAGIDFKKLGQALEHQFDSVEISPEEIALVLKMRELRKNTENQNDILSLQTTSEMEFLKMEIVQPFLIDLRESTLESPQSEPSETNIIPNLEQILQAHIPLANDPLAWFFNSPFQNRAMEIVRKAFLGQGTNTKIKKTEVQHIIEIENDSSSVYAAISGIKVAPGIFIFPTQILNSPAASLFITVDEILSKHPIVSIRKSEDSEAKIQGFTLRKS